MTSSRREFLQWGMGAGAALAFLGPTATPVPAQRRPSAPGLAGYELLDIVPFVQDGRNFVSQRSGEGLQARQAFDLSSLTTKKLITPNDEFFIRTGYPQALERRTGWTVTVDGLLRETRVFSLEELTAMAEPLGVHLLECAGSTRNSSFGLMSAADWSGVPIAALLARIGPSGSATRMRVSGVDPASGSAGGEPRAEWIFGLDELARSGAALALEMNGVALPKDHGAPVRLIVPGWYGCCWIKWVEGISLVDDSIEPTEQMKEYASRTHQPGLPALARDYRPATIGACAMPVRIEKWSHEGDVFYRVIGVQWGGEEPVEALGIGFEPQPGVQPVQNYRQQSRHTWNLWSHRWKPQVPGLYRIRLAIGGPAPASVRMDAGYYDRTVRIEEV